MNIVYCMRCDKAVQGQQPGEVHHWKFSDDDGCMCDGSCGTRLVRLVLASAEPRQAPHVIEKTRRFGGRDERVFYAVGPVRDELDAARADLERFTFPGRELLPCSGCNCRWVELHRIYDSQQVHELMAAHSCDGIGVVAEWLWRDGAWEVYATDTESGERRQVTDFQEDECVPPEPPLPELDR